MTPIVVSESGSFVSTKIGLILNPTSDGFPAQLDIANGAYGPKEAAFPPPSPKPAYASSYDTEGSVTTDPAHYENREITIGMWVVGSGSASVETALNALYKMVGQINREGGVLKFTSPAQTVCYFDLVPEANANLTVDYLYLWKNRAEVTLTFQARPFWRGVEVDLGTTSETALPWLILLESGIDGDVPALGRLVVTDTESGGKDRITVIIGGESRYYSSASTAALGYQAEALTPTATSAIAAGATGASGAGSNVMRNTDLTTTHQAILKSTILSGTASMTHKGTFRVWGRFYRPTSNTGAVSVRLEWAEGDFLRVTQNDPVAYAADDREGVFTWANLGIVSIDPSSTRWEFRLLASSTVAGDEIDVDCFVLFPTEVTYIELSGKTRAQNPLSFSARDEFDTPSVALNGDTAPIGGIWVGAGDADDFSVAGGVAVRTAVSDTASTGRFATLNLNMIATAVQVDAKSSTAVDDTEHAVLARWASATTYVKAGWRSTSELAHPMRAFFTVMNAGVPEVGNEADGPTFIAGAWYTTLCVISASGSYSVWIYPQGTQPGDPLMTGQSSFLATGGALANGDPGIYDERDAATADTRNYDNFLAFVPISDAAIFGTQSLTLGPTYATREDSTGTFSTTISDRRGRYLKIPPAGPESRSTRLAVLALPNDPYTSGDAAAIYDTSAQLFVTPRGLVVPEA